MTLPASGPISMSQVATELGVTASGINLNQTNVRTLAGRPSGTISMSDLLGKSNGLVFNLIAGNSPGDTAARGFKSYDDNGAGVYGSISPSQVGSIIPLQILTFDYQIPPVVIVTIVGTVAQNFFTSVTFNGYTYFTVNAYPLQRPAQNGWPAMTEWTWQNNAGGSLFVIGQTYTVTFV